MKSIVVLVPDEHGVSVLGDMPRVRPVVYEPGAPLPDGAEDAEIVVAIHQTDVSFNADLFRRLPRLRMVQLFSSGVEQWKTAVPAEVHISNADRAHGGTVAEWVVAQLLSHVRDLHSYRLLQQHRRWQVHATDTLAGKRVLVFGAGDIGENLRSRLEPFECAVTLVGRTARTGVVDQESAMDRISEQDVVILALPLTEATTRMADAAFLAAMKDGAILVNAGRGGLVDTEALLHTVHAGRLHAILDVTDPEPLPEDHALWDAPGVVVTPHVAGIAGDTRGRCWAAIARNVQEYVDRARAGG